MASWIEALKKTEYQADFIKPKSNKEKLKPKTDFERSLLREWSRPIPIDATDDAPAAKKWAELRTESPDGKAQYIYYEAVTVIEKKCLDLPWLVRSADAVHRRRVAGGSQGGGRSDRHRQDHVAGRGNERRR